MTNRQVLELVRRNGFGGRLVRFDENNELVLVFLDNRPVTLGELEELGLPEFSMSLLFGRVLVHGSDS
jgi:hypothetical protein